MHNPLQPDEEHIARFSNIADPKRRAYAALLSGLDDAVGTVLKALHDSGQDENTLVFFISDNGGPTQGNGSNNTPLHGDKATVWEGGIRVPYVVRWTGKLPAGGEYRQPAMSLDISATAAAAAGAPLGGEGRPVDGVDLLPYLLGENEDGAARLAVLAVRAAACNSSRQLQAADDGGRLAAAVVRLGRRHRRIEGHLRRASGSRQGARRAVRGLERTACRPVVEEGSGGDGSRTLRTAQGGARREAASRGGNRCLGDDG